MKLFDGLYLYEIVMLFLGIVLFVVLVVGLVYQLMHKRSPAGLVVFFVISIVMMGYPSIKSFQVQAEGVTIETTAQALQADPTNPKLRADLEKQVGTIGDRPVSDPATLTRVATGQFMLGNDKAAEQNVSKALQLDANVPNAQALQSKITAVQTLDSQAAAVEAHPDNPAAKTQLQQTLNQATQQPIANPVALAKIARAQLVLGQRDKANENANRALQINPDLTEAKKIQTTIGTRPQ